MFIKKHAITCLVLLSCGFTSHVSAAVITDSIIKIEGTDPPINIISPVTIDTPGSYNRGILINKSEITNNNIFENYFRVTNLNAFTNNGTIDNMTGRGGGGSFTNSGILSNGGTFINNGVIKGKAFNSRTFINNGTITEGMSSSNATFINNVGSVIYGHTTEIVGPLSTMTNDGNITADFFWNNGGTINNTGSIIVTQEFNTGGDFNNSGTVETNGDFITNGGTTINTGVMTGKTRYQGYNNSTFINRGDLIIDWGGYLNGVDIHNFGTLISHSTVDISGRIINNGTFTQFDELGENGGVAHITEHLSGSGTINASLVNISGTLNAGNSPGLMTFNADVAWLPGSTIIMELEGYNRGTEYDAYNINGNLMIDTGVTLDIDWLNLFEPNSGDIFDLAFITGDINGSFDFLPTDWTMSVINLVGNQDGFARALRLTYDASNNTGNTNVPEPVPLTLLGLGLLGIGLARRKRA